ncbi:uncharacterized protein I206_105174 [Kwoniella pini CBS 10737]|uniref:Uncharacterized protein n=2 Tax=Kwoniella pini CBS 10737 TaxID=1296096 RepID=A0AAJ8MPM0_9TREE
MTTPMQIEIIRDILDYHCDPEIDGVEWGFQDLWTLANSRAKCQESVQQKIDQAIERHERGAECNDRRKALYCFARAFLCLMPYHSDAFATNGNKRSQLLEDIIGAAIGIAASGQGSTRDYYELAYCASLINLTKYFAMNAGELRAHIEQLEDISEKLQAIPNTSYDGLTGQILKNVDVMKSYLANKAADFKLEHLDYRR